MVTRVPLMVVDPVILSSYGPGGSTDAALPRTSLKPLATLGTAGRLAEDAALGLLRLHLAVRAAGGDFRVTDCFRAVAEQAAARQKYERWLAAGSPPPSDVKFDPKTMKAAFVAKAGRSNHNAGRAIDVHVSALRFPGVPADRQLDTLWDLARPLGWRPVIKAPTEGASESWHFDFLGPWAPVSARLGYEQAAIAATLDVGQDEAFPVDGTARRIQAQLHRAGYDIGDIDGVLGKRSQAAARTSGWIGGFAPTDLIPLMAFVDQLPSSAVVLPIT